jgi:hypothetical protein
MLSIDPLAVHVARRYLSHIEVKARVAIEYQRRRDGLEPIELDETDGDHDVEEPAQGRWEAAPGAAAAVGRAGSGRRSADSNGSMRRAAVMAKYSWGMIFSGRRRIRRSTRVRHLPLRFAADKDTRQGERRDDAGAG